jgi:hypothetical protein
MKRPETRLFKKFVFSGNRFPHNSARFSKPEEPVLSQRVFFDFPVFPKFFLRPTLQQAPAPGQGKSSGVNNPNNPLGYSKNSFRKEEGVAESPCCGRYYGKEARRFSTKKEILHIWCLNQLKKGTLPFSKVSTKKVFFRIRKISWRKKPLYPENTTFSDIWGTRRQPWNNGDSASRIGRDPGTSPDTPAHGFPRKEFLQKKRDVWHS